MTVAPSPLPASDRLRLLPARPTEPPYDDELTDPPRAAVPPTQGTLALTFTDVPARPALRLVAAAEPADDEFIVTRTERSGLPDPRAWSARLVQAMVEALAGERSVSQLARWTSERVYTDLERTARRRRPRGQVRSVHVSEPSDGVAEACALVASSDRCRTVALRLDGLDGRWVCTALHLG